MFKSINGGILPQRATKYSAGFDVFANEDVVIGAGETKTIGVGVALDDLLFDDKGLVLTKEGSDGLFFDISQHYFSLHIRSSLRAKGLTSLGTGIIDMDYRDEIKMVIHNPLQWVDHFDGSINPNYEIKKGDKIGQIILCRHEGWLLPSEYTKDEERIGGFGSSGER